MYLSLDKMHLMALHGSSEVALEALRKPRDDPHRTVGSVNYRRRRHSGIGYRTPAQAPVEMLTKAAA
jgi:hypothetical protein